MELGKTVLNEVTQTQKDKDHLLFLIPCPYLLITFFFFFWFFETGFLCIALAVDQAGLELRNPPASASQVLGLKAWATTAWLNFYLIRRDL